MKPNSDYIEYFQFGQRHHQKSVFYLKQPLDSTCAIAIEACKNPAYKIIKWSSTCPPSFDDLLIRGNLDFLQEWYKRLEKCLEVCVPLSGFGKDGRCPAPNSNIQLSDEQLDECLANTTNRITYPDVMLR